MRPLQLKKTIIAAIDAQIALFIWGPPGVGKSKLTEATAADIGYGLIDLRLSQLDPADIRGIPSIDHERHLSIWNAQSEANRAFNSSHVAVQQILDFFNILLPKTKIELLSFLKRENYRHDVELTI